jgi:two-component system, cell cycle response regulator DivK
MTTRVRRWSCATGAVVLLVQPERDDRDLYAEYLSHMGLTPLCVQEAAAALRVARRADIIVTGLLLPGPIDGCGLIDRLRHSADTCNIPIAMLTGCAWTTEEIRARNAGCDVFLSKPCFPHVLLREIRRMLAARTPGRRRYR